MAALKYLQVSVNICNLVSAAEFLREGPEQAPSQGALHPLQIWLNPLGIY